MSSAISAASKLMFTLRWFGSLVTLGVLVQVAAAQNLDRAGVEFQANTFTTGSQTTNGASAGRGAAIDSLGNFVLVWNSENQDGGGTGIYAQRYSASGTPLGGEFRVNTTTAFDQDEPAIAMDANGNFVIAWESNAQDGDAFGIYAQRFNSSGTRLGGEFRVNTTTAGFQRDPCIAMTPSGNFVIVWDGQSSNVDEAGSFGIYAQRYNNVGVRQGGEFRVNTFAPNDQFNPAIAMNSTGDFVVTWVSDGQEGDLSTQTGIYAQRFNAAGVAQGTEFHVNTYTDKNQDSESIAMDASGNFLIAWNSFNQGITGNSVHAQLFNAAGVPQGAEFPVNSTQNHPQSGARIVAYGNGEFLITYSILDQDGFGSGVFARRFSPSGVPLGDEFLVNTQTFNQQSTSDVATNGSNFVFVWSSFRQDGDSWGIFGQRYVLALPAQRGQLLISEFRMSGPLGPQDEYYELYNNTDSSIDISGFTFNLLNRAGSAVFPVTLPAQTGIPPRGHYLIAGEFFQSAEDQVIAPANNSDWMGGIALLNRGAVIDSVLFSDAAASGGASVPLFREGTPLPQTGESTLDHAWIRDPSSGTAKDTDDNAADFILLSTTGGSVGGVAAHLGAPGPEYSGSPILANATVSSNLIDATAGQTAAPNRVRDAADIGTNKALGTLAIRRRFTNQTGQSISQLRFRIIATMSGPAPPGTADLRALTSNDVNVTVADPAQCAPNPAPCMVMVRGTTLDEPPGQPNGGGLNSTLSAGQITLATPLANGASINVQFMLGIQQGGAFRFYVNIEALP